MTGAPIRRLQTDILILGSGGAGLFAALHAHQANPKLKITVAVKGLQARGEREVWLRAGDELLRFDGQGIIDSVIVPGGLQTFSLAETLWVMNDTYVGRLRQRMGRLLC